MSQVLLPMGNDTLGEIEIKLAKGRYLRGEITVEDFEREVWNQLCMDEVARERGRARGPRVAIGMSIGSDGRPRPLGTCEGCGEAWSSVDPDTWCCTACHEKLLPSGSHRVHL